MNESQDYNLKPIPISESLLSYIDRWFVPLSYIEQTMDMQGVQVRW